MRKIHFIAIGGQGMSGIASILLKKGYEVSGSDIKQSELTTGLQSMGAEVSIGHRPENLQDPDVVVVSSAIGPDNPELIQAKAMGIPIVHRMDMLLQAVSGLKLLAVAGSHGKTTITSMLAWIFRKAKLDPTFLVGGQFWELGTSYEGQGDWAIFETDESDGSFLKVNADIGLATNIDNDHLDHWGSVESLREGFFEFLDSVKPQGLRVVCSDDRVLGQWAHGKPRVLTYGFEDGAFWRGTDYAPKGWGAQADIRVSGNLKGSLKIALPGRHNMANAIGAAAASFSCGIAWDTIVSALQSYPGIKRRLERIGEYNNVLLLDDFAHHPTEMTASLSAIREAMPGSKIIAVFQPHRFSRTRLLKKDLGRALLGADSVFVTSIYAGPGEKIENIGDAGIVAEEARTLGHPKIRLVLDKEKAMACAAEDARDGDVIVTMGAGDVWKTHPLAKQILLARGE